MSPDAAPAAPAYVEEDDGIVTSYDPVVDHRTTYQADPSASATAEAKAAHPYYTTFESHPYYTYFEPSPYRIPTDDETYAEWYYQQQQQQQATGGAADLAYDHVTYDHATPLHEIVPEAPTKLSHAHYTNPGIPGTIGTPAGVAPAPTSYFYDSRIQQHQQQQLHPQQQQQQQHQPLTNSLSGGFESQKSQKLNELRQKYTSPPYAASTAASVTASTAASTASTAASTTSDDEVDPEAITTSAPRVTVSVSKSVTTSVRRVTADGVTLITPMGDTTDESDKLQVIGYD